MIKVQMRHKISKQSWKMLAMCACECHWNGIRMCDSQRHLHSSDGCFLRQGYFVQLQEVKLGEYTHFEKKSKHQRSEPWMMHTGTKGSNLIMLSTKVGQIVLKANNESQWIEITCPFFATNYEINHFLIVVNDLFILFKVLFVLPKSYSVFISHCFGLKIRSLI